MLGEENSIRIIASANIIFAVFTNLSITSPRIFGIACRIAAKYPSEVMNEFHRISFTQPQLLMDSSAVKNLLKEMYVADEAGEEY